MSAAGAAFVNGTAAHGEDFDDTFEGGPVHAGAVIVPAVLAACERHNPDGRAALRGIAVGIEVMCRLEPRRAEGGAQGGLSSDRGVRRDGRGGRRRRGAEARPTSRSSTRSASPARWRAASSNISPKAPGPSACMPAGRRNRACAPRCWRAPASPARAPCSKARTACSTASPTRTDGDYDALTRRLRHALADARRSPSSPIPCGTMTHPYIDCARRLARAASSRTTSRRWSATSARAPCTGCGSRSPPSRRPPNGYAGKFSQPYCIAAGFVRGNVGLERFHRRRGAGPARARAGREGPLPDRPAQSLSATIHRPCPRDAGDGSVIEERQPHLRGGAQSR